MYRVLISKQIQESNDSFFGVQREHFECFLPTSEEVCDLINNLSPWFLSFNVQKIIISDSSVFSQVLENFNLKD